MFRALRSDGLRPDPSGRGELSVEQRLVEDAMGSILVIEGNDVTRFGLEALVLSAPELRLSGSAQTLAAGLSHIADHAPDLVLMELALPDAAGLQAVEAVVEAQRPRRTLVLSSHDELVYGPRVISLGCDGYLMKREDGATIVQAISAVLHGHPWVSGALNSALVSLLLQRKRHRAEPAQRSLSSREIAVLEHLRSGRTTKQISLALGISERTVDVHRAHIKKKLGLRTSSELIAYASHHLAQVPSQPGLFADH